MDEARATGVVGLGLDLVEVERMRRIIERQGARFLQRVFTRGERDYCSAKSSPAVFYAARFAAKEAVSKAFGTGIGAAIGWLDIEVVRNPAGVPEVHLTGKGAELAGSRGVDKILLSLTHTETVAAASVVLQAGGR
jgi:holo-[acyl-carrier protein] synthase